MLHFPLVPEETARNMRTLQQIANISSHQPVGIVYFARSVFATMERDVLLESIRIPHMPEELHLFAALFSDVQNPVFLREQLLAGNTAFEYAFIDASMVSRVQSHTSIPY